jgi:hypothetical protein
VNQRNEGKVFVCVATRRELESCCFHTDNSRIWRPGKREAIVRNDKELRFHFVSFYGVGKAEHFCGNHCGLLRPVSVALSLRKKIGKHSWAHYGVSEDEFILGSLFVAVGVSFDDAMT